MRAIGWSLTLALTLTLGAVRAPERAGAAPVPRTVVQPKRAFGPPAAYPVPPEASHALAALDRALVRVWELRDPRDTVVCLVDAIAKLDGPRACARARAVAVKLNALDLPPVSRIVWEALAVTVAPWDLDLRDEFLWLARRDAARALKVDGLWIAPPPRPGEIPFGDPQHALNYERQGLEYRARLWAAIMEYERDRERGIEHARALFAETDPLPWVPLGCSFAWQSCDLKEALARLDPRLLFALPTPYRDSALAGYGSIASSRWREGYRDGLTGAYALHALGAGSAENLWPHAVYYDTSAALKSALQLPAVPHDAKSPRASALAVLLAGKAWTDPEGALALAEAETPGAAREHVISSVAGVWASARPERIGRAMRALTDAHLRDEHGRTAKEELARRAEGLPPRDSLLKVQQARVLRYQRKPYPQPPTRASAHPDVIRVLANPANTAWLTGPTRDVRLREAAEVAYHDRDNSETFDAVLALLPAPPQPEGWDPQSVFSNWFWHGRKVDAFTLLRDTKSPGLYCAHALDLVRSLSRREDW